MGLCPGKPIINANPHKLDERCSLVRTLLSDFEALCLFEERGVERKEGRKGSMGERKC